MRQRTRDRASGPLCAARSFRYGIGDERGHGGAYLRALLHDEKRRARHRAGTIYGVRHCEAKRWIYLGVQRAREGIVVQGLFAASRPASRNTTRWSESDIHERQRLRGDFARGG